MSTLFDDLNDPSVSSVIGSAGAAEPAKPKTKRAKRKTIINNNLRGASFTYKKQRVLPGQQISLPAKDAEKFVKARLADYAD